MIGNYYYSILLDLWIIIYYSYYRPVLGEPTQSRRNYVMSDPYDSRHRFKVTDVTTILVHEYVSNADPYSPDKLDIIFGMYFYGQTYN